MAVDPVAAYGPSLARAVDAVSRYSGAPRSEGLISQNASRQEIQSSQIMIGGTAYFMGIPLLAGDLVSSVSISLTAAGVAVTLGKVGLYTTAGVQLAVSANQTTAWESVGVKTTAMATPYTVITSGLYYAALVAVAGTLPTPGRISAASTSLDDAGAAIGAGASPFGVQTAAGDLLAPATIVVTGAPITYWIGVS